MLDPNPQPKNKITKENKKNAQWIKGDSLLFWMEGILSNKISSEILFSIWQISWFYSFFVHLTCPFAHVLSTNLVGSGCCFSDWLFHLWALTMLAYDQSPARENYLHMQGNSLSLWTKEWDQIHNHWAIFAISRKFSIKYDKMIPNFAHLYAINGLFDGRQRLICLFT